MKKTLTLIFGIFFLVSLVSTTSVGTLDMTEGKVVYTPPEVSDAEIVCADCNLNDLGNVNAGTPANQDALIWDVGTSKWIPSQAIAALSKWFVSLTNGYLYNSSDTIYFNDTRLNLTIDSRMGAGANASWNQTRADSLYLSDGNYSILTGLISNASYLSTYNVTYHNKAAYQFTDNNFNGSGNFTTFGEIGIGTITPEHTLDVVSANYEVARFKRDTGGGGGGGVFVFENDAGVKWAFGVGSTGNSFINERDGNEIPFQIEQNTATNTLCLDNHDRVGIGSCNPGYKLDVEGSINIMSGQFYRANDQTFAGYQTTVTGTSEDGFRFGSTNAYPLALFAGGGTGGFPSIWIDEANQNVGVKTHTPTHDLNVVGNVNVTGNLIVGGCIQYNCSDSCITLGTCI